MSNIDNSLAVLLAAKITVDPGDLKRIIAVAVAHPQAEVSEGHAPPIQSASTEEETQGGSRTWDSLPNEHKLSTALTEISDDDDEVVPDSKKGKSPIRSLPNRSSQARCSKAPSSKPDEDTEDGGDKCQLLSEPKPTKKRACQDMHAQHPKDQDQDEPKPKHKLPKKRSRQDERAQSPEVSDPTPEVEKAVGAKKAAFKLAPRPTTAKSPAPKTSKEMAPPSEPPIIMSN
ncbi:hypothetical protein FRC11_014411 [Ceratobasidium sp. 423]|nr:hypothetical protein FRC11_014411 [Ceratobasidium sp. 423]